MQSRPVRTSIGRRICRCVKCSYNSSSTAAAAPNSSALHACTKSLGTAKPCLRHARCSCSQLSLRVAVDVPLRYECMVTSRGKYRLSISATRKPFAQSLYAQSGPSKLPDCSAERGSHLGVMLCTFATFLQMSLLAREHTEARTSGDFEVHTIGRDSAPTDIPRAT